MRPRSHNHPAAFRSGKYGPVVKLPPYIPAGRNAARQRKPGVEKPLVPIADIGIRRHVRDGHRPAPCASSIFCNYGYAGMQPRIRRNSLHFAIPLPAEHRGGLIAAHFRVVIVDLCEVQACSATFLLCTVVASARGEWKPGHPNSNRSLTRTNDPSDESV